MKKTKSIIKDNLLFLYFKEFSNNTAFLFFPLISEIVLYWLWVPSWIHIYLIFWLLLQTYLLIKFDKYSFISVYFLNSFVSLSYLFFEYLIEWNIFINHIYSLYFFYVIINAFLQSLIRLDNFKINKLAKPFDIFIKLLLIPVFYYILDLTKWDTNSSFIGFYFYESNIHTFLLCVFIFLWINFSIDMHLSVLRENILNKVLSVLHKYSTWIVDEKDLSLSVTKWEMDLSSKKMYRAVLFMDIRWFTSWSEKNEANAITDMLNWFYMVAENVIKNYSWVINKYVADEIVILFDDLWEAIDFSLELKEKEIDYLDNFWLKVGIWINAWELIYGWIWSEFKKEQTVIWDVVNVAARLEWWINQIRILKSIVPEIYEVNDLWKISLKWKSNEMSLVEIISKKV